MMFHIRNDEKILKFYAEQKMQSYEIVVVVYFVAVHVDF